MATPSSSNKKINHPKLVDIHIGDKAYMFHFYKNENGRYVALSNTVGCYEEYGEGYSWWAALSECMAKLINKGVIKYGNAG